MSITTACRHPPILPIRFHSQHFVTISAEAKQKEGKLTTRQPHQVDAKFFIGPVMLRVSSQLGFKNLFAHCQSFYPLIIVSSAFSQLVRLHACLYWGNVQTIAEIKETSIFLAIIKWRPLERSLLK